MGPPSKRKVVRRFFSGMSEAEESQAVHLTQQKVQPPLSSSYSEIRLSCRNRCLREIRFAHKEALRNVLEPSINKIISVADQKGETLPTAVLSVTLSTVDRDKIARGCESLMLERPNLLVSTLNRRSCPSKARAMAEVRRIIKEFEKGTGGGEETCDSDEEAPAPASPTAQLLFIPSNRLVVLLPQVEKMDSNALDSLIGELASARRKGVCVSILLLLSPMVPFPVDALCRETSASLRVSSVGDVSTRQILYLAWGNLLTSARLPVLLGPNLLQVVLASFDLEIGSYVTAREILTLALERHIITSPLGFLYIPGCGDDDDDTTATSPSLLQSYPKGGRRAINLNKRVPLWDEKRLADCFHWAGMATVAIAFLVRITISVNPDVNPISVTLKYWKAFQSRDDRLLIGVLNKCRTFFLVSASSSSSSNSGSSSTTTLGQHRNSLPQLIDGLLELLSKRCGVSQLLHACTKRSIIGNAKILRKALDEQNNDDELIMTHIHILFFSVFYCSRRSNWWQNTNEWNALCCNGAGLFTHGGVNGDGGGTDSSDEEEVVAAGTTLFFQPRQMLVKELLLPPPPDINKEFSPAEDISIAFSCLRGCPRDSAHANEWFHDFSNALLDNDDHRIEQETNGGKRKKIKKQSKKDEATNLEEHAARFKWACESLVTQWGLVKRHGNRCYISASAGLST